MNIKWDANKYTENFAFVHQYGNSVIELIDADKGSSVLDLGCGNGALTKALKDKGYLAEGALPPQDYKYSKMGKTSPQYSHHLWSSTAVKRILVNPIYIGKPI